MESFQEKPGNLARVSSPEDDEFVFAYGLYNLSFIDMDQLVREILGHIARDTRAFKPVSSRSKYGEVLGKIKKAKNFYERSGDAEKERLLGLIYCQYGEIRNFRNNLIHSVRYTNGQGNQAIGFRDKSSGDYIEVTKEYLMEQLRLIPELSDVISSFRNLMKEKADRV